MIVFLDRLLKHCENRSKPIWVFYDFEKLDSDSVCASLYGDAVSESETIPVTRGGVGDGLSGLR